jgi:hypothetical protein
LGFEIGNTVCGASDFVGIRRLLGLQSAKGTGINGQEKGSQKSGQACKAKAASRVAKAIKKAPKTVAKKKPVPKKLAPKNVPIARKPVMVARKPAPEPEPELTQRKKGVRKATISSGIHDEMPSRKLGRSRIPIDAPLDVVFQNDIQAREAFMFLGIHSIRDLEQFNPDDLVLRLTGPAKLTVGRIRKILAMNNRCLSNDEQFALEFQELLSRPRE